MFPEKLKFPKSIILKVTERFYKIKQVFYRTFVYLICLINLQTPHQLLKNKLLNTKKNSNFHLELAIFLFRS